MGRELECIHGSDLMLPCSDCDALARETVAGYYAQQAENFRLTREDARMPPEAAVTQREGHLGGKKPPGRPQEPRPPQKRPSGPSEPLTA